MPGAGSRGVDNIAFYCLGTTDRGELEEFLCLPPNVGRSGDDKKQLSAHWWRQWSRDGKKSITGADQWDVARAITELVYSVPGPDIRYLYPAQARTLQ